MTTKVHPFEAAGLGAAPFRYIGCYRSVGPLKSTTPEGFEVLVGSPGQPMGVCNFCGHSIADCYRVRSADGREFIVGCDCIRRVDDDRLVSDIDEDRRALARRKRFDKAEREREAAREWIERNSDWLSATPDPDRPAQTLADKWEWFANYAGHSGRMRLLARLKLCDQKPRRMRNEKVHSADAPASLGLDVAGSLRRSQRLNAE